ncbi:hypothetical protein FKL20_26175, partial [Klebsiella pneumoniae]|nr:hypothetical protein [Klebsiella pneumoniae]
TVCVVGKIRDLILQLSKSSIYSTKPRTRQKPLFISEPPVPRMVEINRSSTNTTPLQANRLQIF